MKKSLFFISVICAIFSVNTWAEAGYVLSTSEQTALQQAVQKIQAQPIRVQEAVIVALKKRTP